MELDPRKRLTPASTSDGSAHERDTKRIRLDTSLTHGQPIGFPSSSNIAFSATPQLLNPFETPPSSARLPKKTPTVSLKLVIPKPESTDKEKQQLAARKGAATKWAKGGKLRRPMPDNKEIKAAYNLKLMRHYPAAPTAPDTTESAANPASIPAGEDNFIRPVIQKSERMTKLLKSFPKFEVPATTITHSQCMIDQNALEYNKKATQNENAQRQAWKSFSGQNPRLGVQVMVESALPLDEMNKESRGKSNTLPEWIKYKTSKFAQEEGAKVDKRKRKRWA
ncbi:hypothetical protein P280DRAFT_504385 [Massarina eburnea CBS 473.64]|uniref:Uncharacterized protein n=1 Tax=Massarina eburnea CBS 473.64 TaxID=1395130 RepID=A0A6A6SDV9_9PLEO|nr:hypothetical protein P280DRAFT_504385 [Massarina eburnea CBS 473.64]